MWYVNRFRNLLPGLGSYIIQYDVRQWVLLTQRWHKWDWVKYCQNAQYCRGKDLLGVGGNKRLQLNGGICWRDKVIGWKRVAQGAVYRAMKAAGLYVFAGMTKSTIIYIDQGCGSKIWVFLWCCRLGPLGGDGQLVLEAVEFPLLSTCTRHPSLVLCGLIGIQVH